MQELSQAAAGVAQGGDAAAQTLCGDGRGVTGQGQLGAELAAEAGLRTDTQASVHGLAEIVGQRQAQAGTAVLAGNAGAGLGERLEDPHLGLVGDADAGVADIQAHATAVGAQAHIDAAEAGELEGVGQQVADNLAYAGRVAEDHGRKLWVDQAGQFDTRRGVL
ncbi:hypothetical protein D3C81_797260 [compost metagenome]